VQKNSRKKAQKTQKETANERELKPQPQIRGSHKDTKTQRRRTAAKRHQEHELIVTTEGHKDGSSFVLSVFVSLCEIWFKRGQEQPERRTHSAYETGRLGRAVLLTEKQDRGFAPLWPAGWRRARS